MAEAEKEPVLEDVDMYLASPRQEPASQTPPESSQELPAPPSPPSEPKDDVRAEKKSTEEAKGEGIEAYVSDPHSAEAFITRQETPAITRHLTAAVPVEGQSAPKVKKPRAKRAVKADALPGEETTAKKPRKPRKPKDAPKPDEPNPAKKPKTVLDYFKRPFNTPAPQQPQPQAPSPPEKEDTDSEHRPDLSRFVENEAMSADEEEVALEPERPDPEMVEAMARQDKRRTAEKLDLDLALQIAEIEAEELDPFSQPENRQRIKHLKSAKQRLTELEAYSASSRMHSEVASEMGEPLVPANCEEIEIEEPEIYTQKYSNVDYTSYCHFNHLGELSDETKQLFLELPEHEQIPLHAIVRASINRRDGCRPFLGSRYSEKGQSLREKLINGKAPTADEFRALLRPKIEIIYETEPYQLKASILYGGAKSLGDVVEETAISSVMSYSQLVNRHTTVVANILRKIEERDTSGVLRAMMSEWHDVYRMNPKHSHELAAILSKDDLIEGLLIPPSTDLLCEAFDKLNTVGYSDMNILPGTALTIFHATRNLLLTRLIMQTKGDYSVPCRPPWVSLVRLYGMYHVLVCSTPNKTYHKYTLTQIYSDPKGQFAKAKIARYLCAPFIPGDYDSRVINVSRLSQAQAFITAYELATGNVVGMHEIDNLKMETLAGNTAHWPSLLRFVKPATKKLLLTHAVLQSTVSKRDAQEGIKGYDGYTRKKWCETAENMFKQGKLFTQNGAETRENFIVSYIHTEYGLTDNICLFGYGGNLDTSNRPFPLYEMGLFGKRLTDFAYAFMVFNETVTGGTRSDDPYWITESYMQNGGSWYLLFLGLNPSDDPFDFSMPLEPLTHVAITKNIAKRPIIWGYLGSKLTLEIVSSPTFHGTLVDLNTQFIRGPESLKLALKSKAVPKYPRERLISYLRSLPQGYTLQQAIDSAPDDLDLYVTSDSKAFENLFYQIMQKPDKPPLTIDVSLPPAKYVTRDQADLMKWALTSRDNSICDQRNLFLCGDTGVGKSAFIDWLKVHFHVAQQVSGTGDFYFGLTHYTEIIVFDDVDKISRYKDLLSLLDPHTEVTLNVKGSQITIRPSPKVVFVTNKAFEHYFEGYPLEQQKAFRRKLVIATMSLGKTELVNEGHAMHENVLYELAYVQTHRGVPYGLRWYPMSELKEAQTIQQLEAQLSRIARRQEEPLKSNKRSVDTDIVALVYKQGSTTHPVFKTSETKNWVLVDCSARNEQSETIKMLERFLEILENGTLIDSDLEKLANIVKDAPILRNLGRIPNKKEIIRAAIVAELNELKH